VRGSGCGVERRAYAVTEMQGRKVRRVGEQWRSQTCANATAYARNGVAGIAQRVNSNRRKNQRTNGRQAARREGIGGRWGGIQINEPCNARQMRHNQRTAGSVEPFLRHACAGVLCRAAAVLCVSVNRVCSSEVELKLRR